MNCEQVGSILDDQRIAVLTATERTNVDQHIARCGRCADEWRVQGILAAERVAAASPELFAELARRAAAVRQAASEPRKYLLRRWAGATGLAAGLALIALTLWDSSNPPAERAADRSQAATSDHPEGPGEFSSRTRELDGERFVAGVHYRRVSPPPTASETAIGSRAEVAEFFMYSCYHCFVVEPQIGEWERKLATDTTLVRVPVIFNAVARLHARAFYTAEALGKLEELHAALFAEINVNGNPLDSESALEALFAREGVDPKMFRRTFDSATVQEQVTAAETLSRSYGISATPSLVIDREFVTNPNMAGPDNTIFAVADWLIAMQRRLHPKALR